MLVSLAGRPIRRICSYRHQLVLIPLTLVAVASQARCQVSGVYGPRLQEIVEAYHALGLFQGAVMVTMRDEVVYRGAVGLANEEWGIPNTPDTRFTIASLGKAFTAVMILQLQEERLLSVGDRVHEHVTEFQGGGRGRITIEHLLHHTAGIPWPQDEWEPFQFARNYELSEIISLVLDEAPVGEPGGEFAYCNSCYHLLAAIIERVTGNSYEDELRSRILEPLQLANTGIAYAQPLIERRASGYERLDDGRLVNAIPQDQSYAVGAGGMYSTVDDLFRWHQALNGNELLSDSSKALVFDRSHNRNGFGWSLGAYVEKDVEGLRTLALGLGGTPGFASGLARLLDDNYFIVFLGNVRPVPQIELMNDLWNTILGFEVDLPTGS